jgi:RimJ/RimL family protein N-acetyltransferase
VYRYLFDGSAPSRQFIAGRIEQGAVSAAACGLGIWRLLGPYAPYAGCVQLHPDVVGRWAEITYFLDPACWGKGLTVRMAWTVIALAFCSGHIDTVMAGADAPNEASFAVMRRLGMRFHRHVAYPLGAGAEYVLHRDDPGPQPRPEPMRFAESPLGG